jgi:hypothetical protein
MQPKTPITLMWQRAWWLAFMVVASVALSLGFACATPLAAFAAMSALSLDRRNAVLFTGVVWLANQVVGYSILGYPLTANSFAWGVAIGLAAIMAVLVARWCSLRFAERSSVAATLAVFVVAFAAYELMLFVAAFTALGGIEAFTADVIGRILEINAIAMTGLVLINRIGARREEPDQMARALEA